MFFESLWNLLRCALCRRCDCNVRYHIGNWHYYSHLGFVKSICPKEMEKIPYRIMSVQEIIEQMENNEKED